MNKVPLLGLVLAGLVGFGIFLLAPDADPDTTTIDQAAIAESGSPTSGVVQVWKSPTCGCCSAWVDHLRAAGFTVEVTDVDDIARVKREMGVPGSLQSCHTALVDGYVVEGHVPAADVRRLLAERPDVAGLAVPEMPIGSPGMEMGDQHEPYEVQTFTADGAVAVYSEH